MSAYTEYLSAADIGNERTESNVIELRSGDDAEGISWPEPSIVTVIIATPAADMSIPRMPSRCSFDASASAMGFGWVDAFVLLGSVSVKT